MEITTPDFTAGIKNTGLRILIRVLLYIIFAVVPVLWWQGNKAQSETINELKDQLKTQKSDSDSSKTRFRLLLTNSQKETMIWKDSFMHYVQDQNVRLEQRLGLRQNGTIILNQVKP